MKYESEKNEGEREGFTQSDTRSDGVGVKWVYGEEGRGEESRAVVGDFHREE